MLAGEFEQRRLRVSICAAGITSMIIGSSLEFSTIATPATMLPPTSTALATPGIAAQTERPVGVECVGLDLVAEPDRRHLDQPALVATVEIGVRLDPVDEHVAAQAAGQWRR